MRWLEQLSPVSDSSVSQRLQSSEDYCYFHFHLHNSTGDELGLTDLQSLVRHILDKLVMLPPLAHFAYEEILQ